LALLESGGHEYGIRSAQQLSPERLSVEREGRTGR
jgi:hypothetical protein